MKNGFLLIGAKFLQKILLIKKVDVTSSTNINRNKYSFQYIEHSPPKVTSERPPESEVKKVNSSIK